MTFKELNAKLGGDESAKDWRQAKGGGWLHKSAKVDDESAIQENAIVWGTVKERARVSGHARVYGDAEVSGDAWVSGHAWVSGDAQVSGDAWVSGHARVSGDARVSGHARVYGDARVSGHARVYGDAEVSGDARVYGDAEVSGDAWVSGHAWEKSPLFIVGSRFSLTNAKKGHIQIGCYCRPFEWWKEHGLELAKEHGFTKDQIEEYRAYISLFCKVGK